MYPDLGPMVGFATTATFRCAAAPEPGEPAGTVVEQIRKIEEIPAPRVMVIQDLDDPSFAAVFGEVMVTTYRSFGCVGLVTDGYARDIEQVRPLKFPCFASGIQVSHSYSRLLEYNVDVTVGNVRVRPGDLLHGDANGVTTVPLEIADRVADACEEFMAIEQIIISTAKKHPGDSAAYEKAHRRASAKLDELRGRLRRGGPDTQDAQSGRKDTRLA